MSRARPPIPTRPSRRRPLPPRATAKAARSADLPPPPPDGIIVVCASGPSLTRQDVTACRHRFVIVINETYRMAPWAAVLYASDSQWWNKTQPVFAGRRFTQFHDPGQKAPQELETAARFGVTALPGHEGRGLNRERPHLNYGGNSGHQSVNLAYHIGCRRIVLLGFDMRPMSPMHWHGDHPAGLNNGGNFPEWRHAMHRMAADLAEEGIEIINCSRETALDIPRGDLHEALYG